MALIENTLFGVVDKEQQAIERIRQNEPEIGYDVSFSGGKDSTVAYDLVKRAGVKYRVKFCLTTVDPPELIYFVRQHYPEVEWIRPKKSMWQLISDHGFFPTRFNRYCTSELKQTYRPPAGGAMITGVRAAESRSRSKRQPVDVMQKFKKAKFVHPIFEWTDEDVWEYIHKYKLPYCKLYDEGWKRLGCLLCPLAGQKHREWELTKYPKYAELYRLAIKRTKVDWSEKHPDTGTPDEMFECWLKKSANFDTKATKESGMGLREISYSDEEAE